MRVQNSHQNNPKSLCHLGKGPSDEERDSVLAFLQRADDKKKTEHSGFEHISLCAAKEAEPARKETTTSRAE